MRLSLLIIWIPTLLSASYLQMLREGQCTYVPNTVEQKKSSIEPKRPSVHASEERFFCAATLLLWQSKMNGLEFAAKSYEPTNTGGSPLVLKEKAFVPDFAWRPGCKVDVGYDFGFDGWNLASRWTFYRGEDTSLKKHFAEQVAPQGMGVIPLWFYPFYTVDTSTPVRFTNGKMSWRHLFDSIDLEMGRVCDFSKKLWIHLFAGLKGAWMHQAYRVQYENGATILATLPGMTTNISYTLIESASHFKNATWGGGPRTGFHSKWRLGYGISLIADASLSFLFSAIETKRDQNDLNLNTTTDLQEPFSLKVSSASHQLKSVVETKLGLSWETWWYKRHAFHICIEYELQYWWAQNELRRNFSYATPGNMLPVRGDLQMHGLDVEVGYAY